MVIDFEALFNPPPRKRDSPAGVPVPIGVQALEVSADGFPTAQWAQRQDAPAVDGGPAHSILETPEPDVQKAILDVQAPEALGQGVVDRPPVEPAPLQQALDRPAPTSGEPIQEDRLAVGPSVEPAYPIQTLAPTETPAVPCPAPSSSGLPLSASVEAQSPPAAPRRFDLQRIPTQARPLLEEFAQGMGEDLLAISPVRCSWLDCPFPATVLIRIRQEIKGEMVPYLAWGCPRCGREYRPKVLSTQQFDRIEAALFGQQRESPEAPETDAARPEAAQAQAQRLLDFGQRHGWSEMRLAPWAKLPGGECNWRLFVQYLASPSKVPLAEAGRQKMMSLAQSAIEAWERKQACSTAGTRLPAAAEAQNTG